MEKYLTYVEQSGSNIYYRYYQDGQHHAEVVSDFPIYLYMKARDGEHRSLYGDALKEFEFDNIKDAREFVDKHKDINGLEIFGNQGWLQQFMASEFGNKPPNIKFDILKIGSFDIETEHGVCTVYPEDFVVDVAPIVSDDDDEIQQMPLKRFEMLENRGDFQCFDEEKNKWLPYAESCYAPRNVGFPDADKAECRILSISIKDFGGESTCFGYHDDPKLDGLTYVKCTSERDLLYRFMAHIRTGEYHILTGWNIGLFDIPYIINRIEKVCGEGEAGTMSIYQRGNRRVIKKINTKDVKGNEKSSFEILGITCLDMIELYKKFNRDKLESYRLGFVGEHEGVGTKVDYSEYKDLFDFYRKNPRQFYHYNDMDNQLVEQINQKKKFIELGLAISALTYSPFSDCMGTVAPWDNLIFHMAKEAGEVIPPKVKQKRVSNAGGYVKESQLGMHRWPVTLDLTSLYPSIIQMLNLSPDTRISEPLGGVELVDDVINGKLDLRAKRSDNECIGVNGAKFKRDVDGIIPRAMIMVGEKRRYYKNLKKAKEIEIEKLLKEKEELLG